jgi:hypothetical protein
LKKQDSKNRKSRKKQRETKASAALAERGWQNLRICAADRLWLVEIKI